MSKLDLIFAALGFVLIVGFYLFHKIRLKHYNEYQAGKQERLDKLTAEKSDRIRSTQFDWDSK